MSGVEIVQRLAMNLYIVRCKTCRAEYRVRSYPKRIAETKGCADCSNKKAGLAKRKT